MGFFNLDNQQMARTTSREVYKNLYQDINHKDGYGINETFITPEKTKAMMVDILVAKPIGNKLRMRGAKSNGGWANINNLPNQTTGQRAHVLTKRFSIDITKRYDSLIAVSEDEVEGLSPDGDINEGFRKICQDQISRDIALAVNGYTFASQFYSFFMDSFSKTVTADEVKNAIEIYTYDSTRRTDAIRAFKLSNAKVSRGDSKLYAGYFPADKRQAFIFDSTYLVDLTDTVALTASDVASRMLAGGGMNAFTNEQKTVADFQKGYVGWLDGIPLYEALQQIKDEIYYYLGLDPTADAEVISLLDQMACMIAPCNATLRGLRPTSFKVVDDPDTQGVLIQPKVNMGVRCLSGNSLKVVFNGDDFATAEKALASIQKIRDGLEGRFLLPNLSYDHDPEIGVDNYLQTYADGTQDSAVEGVAKK